MRTTLLSGLTLALITASGCSNDKPSTRLFAKLIEQDLAKAKCTTIPNATVAQFPIEIGAQDRKRELLDAFAEAGLVKMEEAEKQRALWKGDNYSYKVRNYQLTEAGQKEYITITSRMIIGSVKPGSFCANNYALDEVTNFTMPTANSLLDGVTTSTASYTVSPINIRPWTQTDSIKKALPEISEAFPKSQKMKTTFILTNNGWISEFEWMAK